MQSVGSTGLAVLRNGLDSVTDIMSVTLVETARSPSTRLGWDFSSAILSADGELIGQGLSQPIHLAGMMPALRGCLDQYQGRIYPGDVLASNDPYEGGSHLPDIFLFKPVFVGDVLLAFMSTMIHHVDMGGMTPGSQGYEATEIYQEGLRIPPLKLYDRGEANETLLRILEKAVRSPDLVLGDFQAQIAAINFGEAEFIRVVNKYGVEEFKNGVQELLDYTERLTRQGLRSLPDGTWSFTDHLDNDGITDDIINVTCTLTKKDDELHVDFAGSSPQCLGGIQGMFSTNRGMVYIALKTLLGGDIPNTSGLLRPITITAPEGTFVNPMLPAPVAGRSTGCRLINHAVWGALAQMVPERVFGCPGGALAFVQMSGYDKSTLPWKGWMYLEGGQELAMGGRHGKDGIEAQCTNVTQLAKVPAELIELELPIMVEEDALWPDSEGAGEFRGGLGMVRQLRYLMDDTTVQICSDRTKQPPWGVAGGGSAARSERIFNPGTEDRVLPGKGTFRVKAGDRLRTGWPGAGGYGNPLKRDPEKVLWDVIEEKVSVRRAREVYGVAVDVESRTVDWEATRQLRQELTHKGALER